MQLRMLSKFLFFLDTNTNFSDTFTKPISFICLKDLRILIQVSRIKKSFTFEYDIILATSVDRRPHVVTVSHVPKNRFKIRNLTATINFYFMGKIHLITHKNMYMTFAFKDGNKFVNPLKSREFGFGKNLKQKTDTNWRHKEIQ